ncbi:MAG: enoyl-CoA hydratase/isomerase family protein [Candidatus Lokiarchaeota archaeon]
MIENRSDFGKNIKFKIKKRFGIIALSRTSRSNAFTIGFLECLKECIKYCQENEKVRGLILTNDGNSFSTGMDLDFIDGSDHLAVKNLESTAADIVELLYNGKPTIAAVSGRCMGEGVVFTICCDYRIATKGSFFQMPEIYSGIFPGTGCVILFSKILGIPWTKKLLMFAEKVDAKNAKEINLIDKIVSSKDELIKEALKKARFLFTKNQTVLNLIKLCSNHLPNMSYKKAYEIEKQASGWYEYQDKKKFLKDFRKNFLEGN